MEMMLICHACGHEEKGSDRNSLMLKIKMWNHVNKVHPDLVERFRDIVDEPSSVETTRQ